MPLVDIPAASAVIVAHDSGGGIPIASGGALSAAAVHRLDYDGRQGSWEQKGGVDREMTDADERLYHMGRLSVEAGRQLDYISRTGQFADKGAGKMEDCTFWNQDGPMTRAEVERDMLDAGGCFLKSIVTVDRRYAEDLQLSTKADFERLMRNTWNDAVMKWGVTDNPLDIRWHAEFHTDAEHSLHVHVTTYTTGGHIEQGWHPTAAQTRSAKMVVYRDAYAPLRLARDMEQSYLRALIPALTKVECGMVLPQAKVVELERKAEAAGERIPELKCSLSDQDASLLLRRLAQVKEEFEHGDGRIGRNYPLQAAAADVFKTARQISPRLEDYVARYQSVVERKADMAGLAVERKADVEKLDITVSPTELSQIQKITQHERDRFVRKDMDDLRHRVNNQVIRGIDPVSRKQELVREMSHVLRRGIIQDAITVQNNKLELRPEVAGHIKEVFERTRSVAEEDRTDEMREEVEKAIEIISASPELSRRIEDALRQVDDWPNRLGVPSVVEAREEVHRALRDDLKQEINWRLENDKIDFDREARQVDIAYARRVLTQDVIRGAIERDGVALGLSRSQSLEVRQCLGSIKTEMQTRGIHKYEDLSPDGVAQVKRVAATIANAPTMQRCIARSCARLNLAHGEGTVDAHTMTVGIKARLERTVVFREEQELQREAQREQQQQQQTRPNVEGPNLGLGSILAQALRTALNEANSAQRATMARKRDVQRYVDGGNTERYVDGRERKVGK